MDEKIINFLNKMHLMNLSINCDNMPYMWSSFYAFDRKNLEFIIASKTDTFHTKAILNNDIVGICIAKDTKILHLIQGVQILGKISLADQNTAKIYYKKFPFAIAMNAKIFKIEILWCKFSDNKLGIGNKIIFKSQNCPFEI